MKAAAHDGPRPAIRLCRAMAGVTMVVLLSSCSGGNPVYQPTITQKQASARVEQLLQGTARSITPRPRLEHYMPNADVGQCLAGQDDPRTQVSRTYFLREVRSSNASIGEQVLRLWKKEGYAINDTPGMGTSQPNIHAVTKDDFLIALETTGSGDLSIGATSPCLWPDGTPPAGH